MKRKLFSAMLSIFALLLLMGAAAAPEPSAALLAEEESAVFRTSALETEARSLNTPMVQAAVAVSSNAAASAERTISSVRPETASEPEEPAVPDDAAEAEIPAEPVVEVDNSLLIDGAPAPLTVGKWLKGGTTYVSLSGLSQQLDPAAQTSWDGTTMTVTTPALSITAKVGALYMEANGRYLYIPGTVLLSEDGQLSVPIRTLAKAFGATVGYDKATQVVTVTRGTAVIASGDSFYNENDLFWLSRVIYREAGNQSLEGQMAVGNVVLNRVADPVFPNTVEGVLAQKNQFSSYATGAMAKTNPSQSSIIAAKLVLDGGEVAITKGALFFDSSANSWAARNKTHVATFGGHNFYR